MGSCSAAARIVALLKHGEGAIIASDHVAGLMALAKPAGGQMQDAHLFQHGGLPLGVFDGQQGKRHQHFHGIFFDGQVPPPNSSCSRAPIFPRFKDPKLIERRAGCRLPSKMGATKPDRPR